MTARSLWWKRPFDLLGVALLLGPVAVVGAAVAVAVRLRLGRPIFFTQTRPGLHGKPFRLIKFRTMLQNAAVAGNLPPDDQRLTPFGRRLRATSLDELPELWNVLRGDMSLVGPRPLLPEYLPLYSAEQARRMEVPPGITGWAQIHGRNAVSWEERFAMDTWYVDNASLGLDLRILFRTLILVLRREGITQPGQATMERFRGNA